MTLPPSDLPPRVPAARGAVDNQFPLVNRCQADRLLAIECGGVACGALIVRGTVPRMPEDPIPGGTAPLVFWLHRQALEGVSANTILEGLCEQLLAGGLGLERAVVGFLVFHPQFDGINFSWDRQAGGAERHAVTRAHILRSSPSPFFHMQCTGTEELHYRLDDAAAPLPFPMLEQLRDRGFTDYLAFFQPFGGAADPRVWPELPEGVVVRDGITGSFATARAGGFGEDGLAALRVLVLPLPSRSRRRPRTRWRRPFSAPISGRPPAGACCAGRCAAARVG